MTSVGMLGQSAYHIRPSHACWECEASSTEHVEVILPLPSVSTRAVRLCTNCFRSCYLPLVVGVSDARADGSRPCRSPARLPDPMR